MRVKAGLVFNHTKAIRGELKENASKVVRKTLLDILADAATPCPVGETGNLKDSLSVGGENNIFDMKPGDLHGAAGTAVEYAIYVEFGTVHMAAQPYLNPAAERHRPVFEAAMSHLLEGTGAKSFLNRAVDPRL